MAMLEVKNLHTYFKTKKGIVKAVNDVSYTLEAGRTLGIVGESGSGKSVSAMSILRLLDGNGYIAEGEIIFDGKDLTKLSQEEMYTIRGNRISVIFQEPMTSLNPVFTIGRQLSEPLRIHQKLSKKEAKKRAVEMLASVNIPNPEAFVKQYPHQLSGGMRQRVMIAMALACKPDILIADEPTTALDVTIQAQILKLMNDLQKERGTSIIFITHDLGVVANMADRIAVMYAGKIVEYGTAEEVFYNPQHPYTWALLSSMPDLDTNEKLDAIPGTPPNMIYPPVGDAFAERNKYAMEIDFEMQPPMYEVSPTHYAATWLLHPNAPKVEMPKIITERIRRMKERGGNHGE